MAPEVCLLVLLPDRRVCGVLGQSLLLHRALTGKLDLLLSPWSIQIMCLCICLAGPIICGFVVTNDW